MTESETIDLIQANDRLLGELDCAINGSSAEFQRARELHGNLNHGGGRRFKPDQLHAILTAAITDLTAARDRVRSANKVMCSALVQIQQREESHRQQAFSIDLPGILTGAGK